MLNFTNKERSDFSLLSGISARPPSVGRGIPITPGAAIGRPMSSRPGGAMNSPFSGSALKNNLHTPRGFTASSQAWDPSAATLAHHPKRQKRLHVTPSNRGSSDSRSRKSNSSSRAGPSTHSSASSDLLGYSVSQTYEILDDDDLMEDVGEVVQIQRNPSMVEDVLMNSASSTSSNHHVSPQASKHLKTERDFRRIFQVPVNKRKQSTSPDIEITEARSRPALPMAPESDAGATPHGLVPNGPSTSRLQRARTEHVVLLADDPIQDFSDDASMDTSDLPKPPWPAQASKPPETPGRRSIHRDVVSQRVAELEDRRGRISTIPLAFDKPQAQAPRKSIVSNMKAAQRDPIATSSTSYTSKGKATPIGVSRSNIVRFPIFEGYLGKTYIDNTPQRWLACNKATKMLSMSSDEMRHEQTHDFSDTIDDLDDIQICQDPKHYMLSFAFGSRMQVNNGGLRSFGRRTNSVDNRVTLMFVPEHASMIDFISFSMFLRDKRNVQLLDIHAAPRAWQMAAQAAQLPLEEIVDVESSPEVPPPPSQQRTVKKPFFENESSDIPPSGPPKARRSRRPAKEENAAVDTIAIDATPSPQPADDELILVYPFSGPGAIHITRGDRRRLGKSEFLNDTLIEFGLKLWMDDLRDNSPELADQIHVFNTFFYNKLNSFPKGPEGHAHVRKWTSKFDIFAKKYVIVPINENLHWYLAIICDPEYVLQPPPPVELPQRNVVTRNHKRQEDTMVEEAQAASLASANHNSSANADDADGQEVEGMLNTCSISQESLNAQPSLHRGSTPPAGVPAEGTQRTSQGDQESSPLSSLSRTNSSPPPDVLPVRSMPARAMQRQQFGKSLPATAFYDQPGRQEQQQPKADSPIIDVEDDDDDGQPPSKDEVAKVQEEPAAVLVSKPHIFTFDSLGTEHRAVTRRLADYLQYEALDKKRLGLEQTTKADSTHAPVPVQPNYCDCGLYLLHFVQHFFKDPQQIADRLKTADKKTSRSKRAEWVSKDIGDMRGLYRSKIDDLSEGWAAHQAGKAKDAAAKEKARARTVTDDIDVTAGTEDAGAGAAGTAETAAGSSTGVDTNNANKKVIEEDSDDDVMITGETPAPVKPKPLPRPRKIQTSAAAKGKGKAKAKNDGMDEEVVVDKEVGKATRLR